MSHSQQSVGIFAFFATAFAAAVYASFHSSSSVDGSTNGALKIELNICLTPCLALEENLVSASQRGGVKGADCIVTLSAGESRLKIAPHLTLFQVALPVSLLPEASARILKIASEFTAPEVTAKAVVLNAREGSVEVQYSSSLALSSLQGHVLSSLNPLRGDLLVELDPGGTAPDVKNEQVCRYGFAEAGAAFRPHATINWFALGAGVGLEDIYGDYCFGGLDGRYDRLAICVLGPKGTCPQTIASFPLRRE